jgi:amino acid transporter
MNMKYEELLLKMRPQDRHGFAHAGYSTSVLGLGWYSIISYLIGTAGLMKNNSIWYRWVFILVLVFVGQVLC